MRSKQRRDVIDTRTLTAFLKWCTIINVGLFFFGVIMFIVAHDFIYNLHGPLFHISREDFDLVFYAALGFYKIVILTFNLVPYVVLRIIGKNAAA